MKMQAQKNSKSTCRVNEEPLIS